MAKPPPTILGKITPKDFLAKYWQKRPLLVRNAFPGGLDLVSGDELAGLSCEPEVHSRLILEKGGKQPWELRKGPFSNRTFSSLPRTHWTLLVNGVDRYLGTVQQLLDSFLFLPNWRIDDVMISYAVDKGNVGAHVDNFDVFLIQAAGRREWQIGGAPIADDDFVPGLEVRLLRKFAPRHRWICEPGDLLYLPPRFGHHGIAKGSGCITYSVGFRAPTHAEIVDGVATEAISRLDHRLRYSDPELSVQPPGEISRAALKKVRQIVRDSMLDDETLDRWFGRYVTQPKDDTPPPAPVRPFTRQELITRFREKGALHRCEGARLAYVSRSRTSAIVFVNGNEHELEGRSAAFAAPLTAGTVLRFETLQPWLDSAALTLLTTLVNEGVLYFSE